MAVALNDVDLLWHRKRNWSGSRNGEPVGLLCVTGLHLETLARMRSSGLRQLLWLGIFCALPVHGRRLQMLMLSHILTVSSVGVFHHPVLIIVFRVHFLPRWELLLALRCRHMRLSHLCQLLLRHLQSVPGLVLTCLHPWSSPHVILRGIIRTLLFWVCTNVVVALVLLHEHKVDLQITFCVHSVQLEPFAAKVERGRTASIKVETAVSIECRLIV